MKFTFALAALAATAALSAPVSAATIGNLGSAGFTYGTLANGGLNAYTFHADGSSQCLTLAGNCYTGGDAYAIIAQASVPGELLVHPGPGTGGNSAVGFTTTTAGTYKLDALATSYDFGTKNVGYFSIVGGTLTTFSNGLVTGGGANPSGGGTPGTSLAIGRTIALGAGDTLGVFVSNFDGYTGDTTHFSGTIGAVPEPASWAMMIGGFGMAGGAMRRRKNKVTARVAYA